MTGPVQEVAGTAIPLRGCDIDTDRIIPARYVKSRPFHALGAHAFADDRADAARAGGVHPFDDPRYAGATVLIAERNFGCGSSREHAVTALAGWNDGITAVVATSFSNIFQANALANGMPCAGADDAAVQRLLRAVEESPWLRVVLDVEAGLVGIPDRCWTAPVRWAPGSRERLLDGTWDPLRRLQRSSGRIAEVASALPYHRWTPYLTTAHDTTGAPE